MPRPKKKNTKATGDFESFFDSELDDISTPEDSLEIDFDSDLPAKASDNPEVIESIEQPTFIDNSTIAPSTKHTEQAVTHNFGLNISNQVNHDPLIPKTFKIHESTAEMLDNLIYKDKRKNKKIPGTKGFISDFVDNAIWLHLHGLGLVSDEVLAEHLKDYSKYPLNLNTHEDN